MKLSRHPRRRSSALSWSGAVPGRLSSGEAASVDSVGLRPTTTRNPRRPHPNNSLPELPGTPSASAGHRPVYRDHGFTVNPESGAGTALSLGLVAVVAFAGLLLTSIGAAQQVRWQTQLSADLSAVAGAAALRHGYDQCTVAAATAQRNHSELVSCELQQYGQVVIKVSRQVSLQLGGGSIQAIAKAGPRY